MKVNRTSLRFILGFVTILVLSFALVIAANSYEFLTTNGHVELKCTAGCI